MNENEKPFGEIIHSYSRRMAIEDGTLVDLRQKPTTDEPEALDLDEVVANAGIRLPLAMTYTAFCKYIDLTPAAKRAGNDIKGRLWDVVWMFAAAARRQPNKSEIWFNFFCVVERVKPTLCTLKCVCGPGDDSEPVLTLMETDED